MIFTHHGINSFRRAVAPATGALTLEMNVTGQGFDPARTFHVIVIFGYPVDYTVDGTPIANPDAYYNGYLKDGDSVTLGNLPAGVSLTIVEDITSADTAAGYAQVSITGNPGSVIAGTTSTVSFTNSYTAHVSCSSRASRTARMVPHPATRAASASRGRMLFLLM